MSFALAKICTRFGVSDPGTRGRGYHRGILRRFPIAYYNFSRPLWAGVTAWRWRQGEPIRYERLRTWANARQGATVQKGETCSWIMDHHCPVVVPGSVVDDLFPNCSPWRRIAGRRTSHSRFFGSVRVLAAPLLNLYCILYDRFPENPAAQPSFITSLSSKFKSGVPMDSLRVECGQADGDILGAFRSRRTVAYPFTAHRDDGLPSFHFQHPALRFHP